ncbi:MAG TPA: ElyC/SanA/YdcF family protein [Deltaproteobacteria bacterium]|nr:ElyC/SanA/YdcF family protein [Deltaproteobacteria bacterium]
MKKFISALLMPMSVLSAALLGGLLLAWGERRPHAGRLVLTVASILIILSAYGLGTRSILESLEYAYPVLDIRHARSQGVQWVVVLGGGHAPEEALPLGSQLSPASQTRLMEGIRILRNLPGSRLLVSGGVGQRPSEAALMSAMAAELGVEPRRILVEERSRDTGEQALIVRGIIGAGPCVLVTTASHMPRAMAMFRKQGIHAVPAPVGHVIRRDAPFQLSMFFPHARHLEEAEVVCHELLGLSWAWVTGRM